MTREEAKSCIQTIELLRRLAFNVHGVMDVIDAGNCDKIISMLSQEPCEDLISRQAAIDADGLDEEIRCEMCKNPMHTDRGCDGNCKYDEILYEKIIQILNKRITPLPSAQPEPHWIPCSERLPEYGVAVLTYDGHCFCVEKRIPTIRDDEGEPITGDWWVSDDYDEYDGDYYPNLRDGACIAWMPLPECYREGD